MPCRANAPVFCLLLVAPGASCMAQTVVWQESFDGTNNWETGANLNQDVGGSCGKSNKYYISCKENGNAAGACGTGCGSNKTLHVGSATLGDLGAAYDAGGFSNCGSGCFLCNTTTNKRSWSKTISTVGYSTLSLEFDYIEDGNGTSDNATAEYSTDNGASWTLLQDMPKTNNSGCGGQGRWTHLTIPLPSSCWSINTLRIAFHWVNNNDGTGTDPSFAVNDVRITTPGTLPVELLGFGARTSGGDALLEWATASEQDNAWFAVEHGLNGADFNELGRVPGAGNSQQVLHYSYVHQQPAPGLNYYRLRQVDMDGAWTFSPVVPLDLAGAASPLDAATVVGDELVIGPMAEFGECRYMLCDLQGRILMQGTPVDERLRLNLGPLGHGAYVLQLATPEGTDAKVFFR
ncbi:MAG: hypothetical protein M9900_08200 [Flavobacteriales bacterium]|nr:hypothetical protein [Flavobacteriales bacterium]